MVAHILSYHLGKPSWWAEGLSWSVQYPGLGFWRLKLSRVPQLHNLWVPHWYTSPFSFHLEVLISSGILASVGLEALVHEVVFLMDRLSSSTAPLISSLLCLSYIQIRKFWHWYISNPRGFSESYIWLGDRLRFPFDSVNTETCRCFLVHLTSTPPWGCASYGKDKCSSIGR